MSEADRVVELLQEKDVDDPDWNQGVCDDGTYNHQWKATEGLGCQDCGDHSGYVCDVCMTSADAVWEYELYAAIGAMLRARS